MNQKKAILTGVVLAVVFAVLEFLIHGNLLSGIYHQTASVWRPEAEMKNIFWLMTIGQLFFGVFAGLIFAKGYEPRRAPLGQGIRFGLYMAFMMAPLNSLAQYVILPIPPVLAVYWLIAGFVEMVVLGVVASFVYKPA